MKLTINSLIGQSEKAICVELTLEHPKSVKTFTKKQWLPKSVVTAVEEQSIEVKDWFVDKMIAEQLQYLNLNHIFTSHLYKYVIDFSK